MKKVIYDFGSNNGDDLPYYLLKADLVVAVEANPTLCNLIANRFQDQIKAGHLVLENCVLSAEEKSEPVDFFIHKIDHVRSQFPRPDCPDDFDRVTLKSKSVIEIIRQHGMPWYIKIDIEHYDQIILRELFVSNIFPPYISSESHSIEVFSLMVALGKYNAFKLVDGASVVGRYKNRDVDTSQGIVNYSFPYHSAGPFGPDIDGPWMTANSFFRLLAFVGLGWKDIHATNIEMPTVGYEPNVKVNIDVNF
jgi:FkbM family methyltransferase